MTADPTLTVVLDTARLSRVVGCPVRATHLRPKPGVSTVAALTDPGGRPVGWVQALAGDAWVKAAKAQARAREVGLRGHIGSAETGEALLLWGPVQADPRLTRTIARLELPEGLPVLRYNPLRRLVVRQDDRVHRITADKHASRLTAVTRALAAAGLPVSTPLDPPVHDKRVTTWPWVDGTELTDAAGAPALRRLGTVLAQLHTVRPSHGLARRLPHRGWAEQLAAAWASVEQLAMVVELTDGCTRAAAAASEAATLLQTLAQADVTEGPPVVSHGDFSLDQCVLTPDGEVHLLDLDRAALAPRELDLATLRAACLIGGQAGCDEVLDAYADRAGDSGASAPWVATALLARVSEPWRAQQPDWVERTEQIVEQACAVMARTAQQRGDAVGPTGAAVATGQGAGVPHEVVDDGAVVTVSRAWPGKVRDGVRAVTIEGHDGQGRLRAGTWHCGRARLLPPGEDPALPALTETARHGELLVHRAGRRAVVRLDAGGYAKVLRPGHGEVVAAASRTGQALAEDAGLDAPHVMSVTDGTITGDTGSSDKATSHMATGGMATDGTGTSGKAAGDIVHLSVLPGQPLHTLAGSPDWSRAWEAWATAWTRLQALPTEGRGLGLHTDADEAHVLRTWLTRTQGLLDSTPSPERLDEIAYRLERRGAEEPHRLVPAHRDLHDKQLLWDGTRIGVLDLDTACLAHPALDPANLAAHASLREAQGIWPSAAARVAREAASAVAEAAGVDERDWALAEAATVARLVCVYAYRPQWRDLVLAWAEDALTVPA